MNPSPALAVRALLGGHLFYGREGSWMSSTQNGVSPRSCVASAFPRNCVPSAVGSHSLRRADLHRLVSEGPGTHDGSITFAGIQSPLWDGTSPLAGKVLGFLEPEMGSLAEPMSLLPFSEAM